MVDRRLVLDKLSARARDAPEQHGACKKMAHLIPWSSMPAVCCLAGRAQAADHVEFDETTQSVS